MGTISKSGFTGQANTCHVHIPLWLLGCTINHTGINCSALLIKKLSASIRHQQIDTKCSTWYTDLLISTYKPQQPSNNKVKNSWLKLFNLKCTLCTCKSLVSDPSMEVSCIYSATTTVKFNRQSQQIFIKSVVKLKPTIENTQKLFSPNSQGDHNTCYQAIWWDEYCVS